MSDEIAREVMDTLIALDAFINRGRAEPRLPGDIDVMQAANYWGCCEETARVRLRQAVTAGEFTTALVMDPVTKKRIRVWRKGS